MGMYAPQGAPLAMLDSEIDVTRARADRRGDGHPDVPQRHRSRDRGDVHLPAAARRRRLRDGDRQPARARSAPRSRRASTRSRALRARDRRRASARGLLDQERPDVFTQTCRRDPRARHRRGHAALRHGGALHAAGTWELALPLVVAPRYVPGSASGRPTTGAGRSPDTDRAPDASRVTPRGRARRRRQDDDRAPLHERRHRCREPDARAARRGGYDARRSAQRSRRRDPLAREGADGGWVEATTTAASRRSSSRRRRASRARRAMRVLLVLDRSATTRGDADAVEHPFVRALLARADRRRIASRRRQRRARRAHADHARGRSTILGDGRRPVRSVARSPACRATARSSSSPTASSPTTPRCSPPRSGRRRRST